MSVSILKLWKALEPPTRFGLYSKLVIDIGSLYRCFIGDVMLQNGAVASLVDVDQQLAWNLGNIR